MTQILEQREAIGVLKNVKILPISSETKVANSNNEKVVSRTYYVDGNNSEYPTLDKIIIEYKMRQYTDRITDYAVFLTNDSGDVVYLCKYSPQILNTLFNNVILLELSNWRRITQNKTPLRTIDDYSSLMFELGDRSYKKENSILRKTVEKNVLKFASQFQKYSNSNEIIPVTVWKDHIV